MIWLFIIISYLCNICVALCFIPIMMLSLIYEFYLLHTQLKFILMCMLDNLYINYMWINMIPFMNFYGYIILLFLSLDYINTYNFGRVRIHYLDNIIFLLYVVVKILDV